MAAKEHTNHKRDGAIVSSVFFEPFCGMGGFSFPLRFTEPRSLGIRVHPCPSVVGFQHLTLVPLPVRGGERNEL